MHELLPRVTTAREVAPLTTFRSFRKCRTGALLALLLISGGCKSEPATVAVAKTPGTRVVDLKVTQDGFEPTPVSVKKGEPLILKVTRVTDQTCANEILIDGTDINVPLPLNQPVEVRFTPSKSGQIRYGCAMGMMISGVLTVE